MTSRQNEDTIKSSFFLFNSLKNRTCSDKTFKLEISSIVLTFSNENEDNDNEDDQDTDKEGDRTDNSTEPVLNSYDIAFCDKVRPAKKNRFQLFKKILKR